MSGINKTANKRIEYNAVNMAPSVIERIEFKSSPHISFFPFSVCTILCIYFVSFKKLKKRQQDNPAAFLKFYQ